MQLFIVLSILAAIVLVLAVCSAYILGGYMLVKERRSSVLSLNEKQANWCSLAYWLTIVVILAIGFQYTGWNWNFLWQEERTAKVVMFLILVAHTCLLLSVASPLRRRHKTGIILFKIEQSDREKKRTRSTALMILSLAVFNLLLANAASTRSATESYLFGSAIWWMSLLLQLHQRRLSIHLTEGGIVNLNRFISWKKIDRYVWQEDTLTIVISRIFPAFSTEETIEVPKRDRETVDRILATYLLKSG